MRVLINTLGIKPGWGGGEEMYLRKILPVMTTEQEDVQFVVLTDSANHESWEPYERVLADSPDEIASAVSASKAELFFTSLHRAPESIALPYVLYVLELMDLGNGDRPKRLFGSTVDKRTKSVCLDADCLVAPSEFIKKQLLDLLQVPLNKTVVAPLGVSEEYGVPQHCIVEKPYFLFVGKISERKNVPRLLEAFGRIAPEIPHALVVVGQRGEDEPEDWGPRVVRIDRLGTIQLAGLYQHCDLFLCPSLYEGSGVIVLEALVGGARVATGRVGGIAEVAGDAPIYFNPESTDSIVGAMRRAVEEGEGDREHRVRLAKQAVLESTWEHCVSQTVSAFRRAVS